MNLPQPIATFLARAKVVLTAAVTWLVFAALLLSQLATQLGDIGPVGEDVAELIARAVSFIGTAVLIIRRVQPVLDRAARGVLPQERG